MVTNRRTTTPPEICELLRPSAYMCHIGFSTPWRRSRGPEHAEVTERNTGAISVAVSTFHPQPSIHPPIHHTQPSTSSSPLSRQQVVNAIMESTRLAAVSNATAVLQCSARDATIVIGQRDSSSSACRLGMDVCLSPPTAFICFRVPLALQPFTRTSYIYVYVRPEHMTHLSAGDYDGNSLADPVKRAFLQRTAPDCIQLTRLEFDLAEPALFVGPSERPAPKDRKARAIMEDLRSLSRATHLTVFASSTTLSQPLLAALRARASTGDNSAAALNFKRLYGGAGGHVIQWQDPLAEASSSPPLYDELGPPPPSPKKSAWKATGPSSSAGKKRVRNMSDDDDDGSNRVSLRDEMSSLRTQIRRLESRLALVPAPLDSPREQLDALTRKVDVLEARVAALEASLPAQRESLHRELAALINDRFDALQQ
ncbi:hypothetical protein B0J12DRAFT_250613 [Macrophomina phaseolina]|uniref:Uncharacterized protein n=1 Tax=Macrophomina phaseolina TaxID=35725 RepID=A0ABQ8G033_9PEZI|nr:hypothetical protein B0J12DRAFT_250613 [Macrophomina phaseolina]